MLDNAGYRTGYIYRNPLIKGDLPKPKNDVELPPAVSSLGYLLEEEELYKQGYDVHIKTILKYSLIYFLQNMEEI